MSILDKLLAYAACNYITLSRIVVDERVNEGFAVGESSKLKQTVRLYYSNAIARWFSSINM
jgi:hypothetical protein